MTADAHVAAHPTSSVVHGAGRHEPAIDVMKSPYVFPRQRLNRVMKDGSKRALCLVSCGSFSPITYLHLRMFEMAADYVRLSTDYELVGGYLSPVSDDYQKAGLVSAQDRVNMCELAVEQTSTWLMVDGWEARQPEYQPTAVVLDHFEHEINEVLGGVVTATGERRHVQVSLLAGADLIQTMSLPGVWSDQDLDHILGRYGSFIIERSGTNIDLALASLRRWRSNIHLIPQLIHNDVSSTKIRQFLRREMSVRYLIPASVIEYIEDHDLFLDESAASSSSSPSSTLALKRRRAAQNGTVGIKAGD
ncbi:MAG: hypothetical protein M1826_006188 [Phylliscum demangeonii]|nr:MAG: hypothetical protein M1826_006188 [Phylliscum demangeonii]